MSAAPWAEPPAFTLLSKICQVFSGKPSGGPDLLLESLTRTDSPLTATSTHSFDWEKVLFRQMRVVGRPDSAISSSLRAKKERATTSYS
jgi:hypothetical protein